MRCPRCDAKISDEMGTCDFCGQDLEVVHYVRRISNAYYNMALEKAPYTTAPKADAPGQIWDSG